MNKVTRLNEHKPGNIYSLQEDMLMLVFDINDSNFNFVNLKTGSLCIPMPINSSVTNEDINDFFEESSWTLITEPITITPE